MKYFNLNPPPSSGSQILLNDFKASASTVFDLSTDVFTIQRESTLGSGSFIDTRVRVTSAINSLTSKMRGDDWKQIIFHPYDTFTDGIGWKYVFNNNTWLSVFSDVLKSVVTNCTVRRANEHLRWIGEDGVYYEEECVVDYELTGVRDLVRQDDVPLPQGYINVYAQLNSKTEKIRPNQRFLFGRPNQRVCWRVFGNGIMNTQSQITNDETSGQLLVLTVGGYEYNEQLDNLELGIVDYYKNQYSISLSASQISGNTTETYPINATLLLNNIPTSGSLTYNTSSSSIATISASGLLTLNSAGSTIATAYMGGNPAISGSALVSVTASGTTTNEIRITPSDNTSILEEDYADITAYLYINSVQQSDAFTFATANSNVPVADYTISNITANGFRLTNNIMCLEYPLLINATSGSYTKQISIQLNGAF